MIYVLTIPLVTGGVILSIMMDPTGWHPITVWRQTIGVFRGPLLKGVMADLRKYMRPGFHPDDIDTTALFGAVARRTLRLRRRSGRPPQVSMAAQPPRSPRPPRPTATQQTHARARGGTVGNHQVCQPISRLVELAVGHRAALAG
nr:hypothetical protein [Mycobacterium kyorinense]